MIINPEKWKVPGLIGKRVLYLQDKVEKIPNIKRKTQIYEELDFLYMLISNIELSIIPVFEEKKK